MTSRMRGDERERGKRRRCGPVGDALAKLTDRLLAGSNPGGSTDKPKVGSEWSLTYSSHKRTGRSLELSPACEPIFLLYAAWVRSRAERPSVSYTKVTVISQGQAKCPACEPKKKWKRKRKEINLARFTKTRVCLSLLRRPKSPFEEKTCLNMVRRKMCFLIRLRNLFCKIEVILDHVWSTGSHHDFFCWKLHGLTRFVVRVVALLSAKRGEKESFCPRRLQLISTVTLISVLGRRMIIMGTTGWRSGTEGR